MSRVNGIKALYIGIKTIKKLTKAFKTIVKNPVSRKNGRF